MSKVLLGMFILVFSIGAIACGGNGGKGKEEEKKHETVTRPI